MRLSLVPLSFAVASLVGCQPQTTKVTTEETTPTPQATAKPAPGITPQELARTSVVRINSTMQEWSPGQPWEKLDPRDRRALGSIVAGNKILTSAEMVADATNIEVESIDGKRFAPAKVVAIDYEANLALLGLVNDESDKGFFDGTKPLEPGTPPRIGDTIEVLQVENNGMPLITKGTIQGVDLITSFLPGEFFLTYEMKASMQSAESSFTLPVVRDGKLVGVLMSYDSDDQLSDILACEIVSRFLRVASAGNYQGFPSLGISISRTEDPTFRSWLKLKEEQGGLYVSRVRHDSAASKAGLKEGDVILTIDDQPIDRRGYYNDPQYGQLFWSHLVRGAKSAGDSVKMDILRKGEPQTLTATLTRSEADERLVPSYTFGKAPNYLVKGGFIFQELTLPLLESFGKEWEQNAPLNLLDPYLNSKDYEGRYKRIVFLSAVIPTPATVGYESLRNLIVTDVNGKQIKDMDSLVEAFKSPTKELHAIKFDEVDVPIILDEQTSSAVDKQLRMRGLTKLQRLSNGHGTSAATTPPPPPSGSDNK